MFCTSYFYLHYLLLFPCRVSWTEINLLSTNDWSISRCKLRIVLLWRVAKKSDVEMMKQYDGTVSIVADACFYYSLRNKRRTV